MNHQIFEKFADNRWSPVEDKIMPFYPLLAIVFLLVAYWVVGAIG